MNAIARNALSAYSQVDMEVNVAVASPYKLILLLFDGALKAISVAKFNMQSTKVAGIAAKGEHGTAGISGDPALAENRLLLGGERGLPLEQNEDHAGHPERDTRREKDDGFQLLAYGE